MILSFTTFLSDNRRIILVLAFLLIIGISSFLFFSVDEEPEMIEGGVLGGSVGIGGDRIRVTGDEDHMIEIEEGKLSTSTLELSNEGYVYFVNRDSHMYTVNIVREGAWNLRTDQKLRFYVSGAGEYDFYLENDEEGIRLEGKIVY